jgi:hypothetical protein
VRPARPARSRRAVRRWNDALVQRASAQTERFGRGHRRSALRRTDLNCFASARAPAIGIKAAMSFPWNEFGSRVSQTRRSVPFYHYSHWYAQTLPPGAAHAFGAIVASRRAGVALPVHRTSDTESDRLASTLRPSPHIRKNRKRTWWSSGPSRAFESQNAAGRVDADGCARSTVWASESGVRGLKNASMPYPSRRTGESASKCPTVESEMVSPRRRRPPTAGTATSGGQQCR